MPWLIDVYPKVKEAVTITLRPEICALAGAFKFQKEFMVSRLTRAAQVASADNGELSVIAPQSRPDLTREVDLIERLFACGVACEGSTSCC